MDLKRLFGAITLRTLFIGTIVTALSFIYPPALGIFIGTGCFALVFSVAASINKCKRNEFLDNTPIGDLEFYEIPKESSFSKVESKILDSVESISSNIKYKRINKKSQKEDTISK